MQLSDFGKQMSSDAGILTLMDDLGKALAGDKPLAMFGGGNPAQIPAVTNVMKHELELIMADDARLAAMLGNYDTPQGNDHFIDAIVKLVNREYNLGVTRDNVAVTPGSQNGFYMLFNMLAGQTNGAKRKIMLPIVPEYIGYRDQMIEPDSFVSVRPRIDKIGQHEFKYRIDFDAMQIDESVAAIALSRPTNPSGNVVTDDELSKLAELARQHDIPLIIDGAYGLPFPGVIIKSAGQHFDNHTILSLSLSKVGLPSSRVGIFIGPPALMKALSSISAILNLASPGIGQYLVTQLIDSGEIMTLARNEIQPFYADRQQQAWEIFNQKLPGDLPWRLHSYEGTYFFWLWCEGAQKTSKQLYDYLKEHSVIVVPGESFFPGQNIEEWDHARQCIRINFSRPDEELEAGAIILAEAVRWMYN